MKRRLSWVLLLVGLMTLRAGAESGELIKNGLFGECPDPNTASSGVKVENGVPALRIEPGSNAVVGWTVVRAVEVLGSSGDHFIRLGEGGTIEQAFKTVVGQNYKVSFGLAAQAVSGVAAVDVEIGGLNRQHYQLDTRSQGQALMNFNFTARAAQTSIRFIGITNGASAPLLTGVSVHPLTDPPRDIEAAYKRWSQAFNRGDSKVLIDMLMADYRIRRGTTLTTRADYVTELQKLEKPAPSAKLAITVENVEANGSSEARVHAYENFSYRIKGKNVRVILSQIDHWVLDNGIWKKLSTERRAPSYEVNGQTVDRLPEGK